MIIIDVQCLQALGRDVESIYVEELGATLSREELCQILVLDMMEGAIEVDWRDFFPYLRWVPNKSFDKRLERLCFRREVVMKAIVNEQKKRIASCEVWCFSLVEIVSSILTHIICHVSSVTFFINRMLTAILIIYYGKQHSSPRNNCACCFGK